MEFKSLKNIETSFRQIRLFGIVFVSLCALIAVGSVWSAFRFAEAQRQKIYVVDHSKSSMIALSLDMGPQLPRDAREQPRRLHELLLMLSPTTSTTDITTKASSFLTQSYG